MSVATRDENNLKISIFVSGCNLNQAGFKLFKHQTTVIWGKMEGKSPLINTGAFLSGAHFSFKMAPTIIRNG